MSNWWSIEIAAENVEEQIYMIDPESFEGSVIHTPQTATLFLRQEALQSEEAIASWCKQNNLKFCSTKKIDENNWIEQCEELWEEVSIGSIRIVPLLEPDKVGRDELDSHQLLIVPGTGFGTGHHATTSTVIDFLQKDEIMSSVPHSVLDIGTGSGILAIAAVKLFGSQVEGIEIDADALQNARANIDINNCGESISLKEGTFASADKKYDLILANLYAEVLLSLVGDVTSSAKSNSHLIVSGIVESKSSSVIEAFESKSWQMQEKQINEGWCTALLKRV